jgi:subtilisin family serine protease
LALGGPVFSRMLALSSDSAKLSLDIQIIYKTPNSLTNVQGDGAVTADINLFAKPLLEARTQQAIINFSLRSSDRISAIDSELKDEQSPILYVVAAGNERKEIGQNPGIGIDTIYPALYGGQESTGRDRVITVTALDDTGVAHFANFGSKYVDIGAPGCKLNTVVFDDKRARFKEIVESGTSLSAPLVSFTAALLRSEGHSWSPVQIKRRILVSADLDEGLKYKIKDGRKLNVVKAAAITKDVVEENKDAGGRIMIGDVDYVRKDNYVPLKAGDSLLFHCDGDSNKYLQKSQLLKIAYWAAKSGVEQYKVYYKDASPLLDEDVCSAPEGVKLKITDFQVREPVVYDFSQIKDIVMRFSQ